MHKEHFGREIRCRNKHATRDHAPPMRDVKNKRSYPDPARQANKSRWRNCGAQALDFRSFVVSLSQEARLSFRRADAAVGWVLS